METPSGVLSTSLLKFMHNCLLALQPVGHGHVRLSKSFYNFTERQDVRLAVGYRGTVNDKGDFKGVRIR